MSLSRKYGRSFHYPFSPGTTSDDRINHNYWNDIMEIPTIIQTEKIDGQNCCLNKYGVFARSHAAPTQLPWDVKMRERWNLIKDDLGDIEIFGESMYAIHSIAYEKLTSDFYVFGIRCVDMWLSWEETEFYAEFFGLPTVPILKVHTTLNNKTQYESDIQSLVQEESELGSIDPNTGIQCYMEGLVSRNYNEYTVDEFEHNLIKWVRASHVKTDEHWSRNWKKAKINYGTY